VKTYNSTSSGWEIVKHGVPQGSILGPLFFLLYVNDLPTITTNKARIILCADDTSVIISNPSFQDFKTNMNKVLADINEWLKTNLLLLNFKKIHYLQFRTKNSMENDIRICYENKHITNTSSTKFLDLNIDETLSWKYHTDQLVTKLSSACYAVRTVKDLMSQETLRMSYFSYVHSVITYGIIFWCNSPHSVNIFRIQKRIIRIIMNAKPRDL
jgi:hypothetical protein